MFYDLGARSFNGNGYTCRGGKSTICFLGPVSTRVYSTRKSFLLWIFCMEKQTGCHRQQYYRIAFNKAEVYNFAEFLQINVPQLRLSSNNKALWTVQPLIIVHSSWQLTAKHFLWSSTVEI